MTPTDKEVATHLRDGLGAGAVLRRPENLEMATIRSAGDAYSAGTRFENDVEIARGLQGVLETQLHENKNAGVKQFLEMIPSWQRMPKNEPPMSSC